MLRKRPRLVSFFLCGTFLLLFIANRFFFFRQGKLEHLASLITYPMLIFADTLARPIKQFSLKNRDIQALKQHIATLTTQLADLRADHVKLIASLQFAKETNDLCHFQKRFGMNEAILTKVLGKNFSDEGHYFIINRGSTSNVEIDMIAVHKAQLIGRITEVHPFYSKLLLTTDQSCKIAAYTAKSKANGIVEGTNTLNRCSLSYVSHLSPIQQNELVLSSGEGLIFPEGFCLGNITHFSTEDLCHTIEVVPLVDLKLLTYCHLIKGPKSNVL